MWVFFFIKRLSSYSICFVYNHSVPIGLCTIISSKSANEIFYNENKTPNNKKNTYLNRKALIILDPPQFESTAEKKKCRISYPSNITFDEPFKV